MTTINDHANVGLNTRTLTPQLKVLQIVYLEAKTTKVKIHHQRDSPSKGESFRHNRK